MKTILDILFKASLIAYAAFFIYGIYYYPDGPIRPCGHSYCGKQGQPHTVEDYHAFVKWEGILPWMVVLFFLSLAYQMNRDRLFKMIDRK